MCFRNASESRLFAGAYTVFHSFPPDFIHFPTIFYLFSFISHEFPWSTCVLPAAKALPASALLRLRGQPVSTWAELIEYLQAKHPAIQQAISSLAL